MLLILIQIIVWYSLICTIAYIYYRSYMYLLWLLNNYKKNIIPQNVGRTYPPDPHFINVTIMYTHRIGIYVLLMAYRL